MTTEQKAVVFINKLLSDNIQLTRIFVTINQIFAVLADRQFALSSVIRKSGYPALTDGSEIMNNHFSNFHLA